MASRIPSTARENRNTDPKDVPDATPAAQPAVERSVRVDPAAPVRAVDHGDGDSVHGAATQPADADGMWLDDEHVDGYQLTIRVTDGEVVAALRSLPNDAARNDYAQSALKIGVAALQVATGRLDAEVIQRESAFLLKSVSQQLEQHSREVHTRVNSELREYFDPQSGRFNERVKRLVSRDGELEQLLRRQVGSNDSELAKTLLAHFGDQSPLMKLLSPTESDGLIYAMRGVVEEQLHLQREKVLREFSLDNADGALSRLVGEITKNHGQLQRDLQTKLDDVVKEFSLDQENSALSRLVRNVDTAQKTIVREFSLDNPTSAFSRLNSLLRDTKGAIDGHLTLDDEDAPLARLKRELLQLLKEHSRENGEFRDEVKAALAKLVTRREEADRSTRHGLDFEEALGDFLVNHRESAGDVVTASGNRVGQIKNCKVGDFVIELAADSQAAGARIVLEAKEKANYVLSSALEEIHTGRKNRNAQVGIFVYSAKSAPENLEPFGRYGDDLVVVWDAENPDTDVYMSAALTTARALCVRSQIDREDAVDFEAIQRAVLEIEKRAGSLEDIRKYAESVQSASQKILDKLGRIRDALEREVRTLHEKVDQWMASDE